MPDTNEIKGASPHAFTQDQIYGALLGAAVGDALGWPFEQNSGRIKPTNNQPRSDVFQPWRRRAGGKFQPHELEIGSGEYSDDTQLMLATARGVLGYTRWASCLSQYELPLWLLYERGGGGATKRAAESWQRGVAPWKNTKLIPQYFDAGGNGVAMRVLPHVLVQGQTRVQLARDVLRNGILTHGHPRALLGARVYADAAWWIAHKQLPLSYGSLIEAALEHEVVWGQLPEQLGGTDSSSHWLEAADTHSRGDYEEVWATTVAEIRDGLQVCRRALLDGAIVNDYAVLEQLGCFDRRINGSGVVASLVALYLFAAHAADPIVGLRTVAYARSADTDTLASMLGGLFGLSHGIDWIPEPLQQVQDRQLIEDMALQFAHPPSSTVDTPKHFWSSRNQTELLKQLEEHASEIVVGTLGQATVMDCRTLRTQGTNLLAKEWRLQTRAGQTLFIKRVRKTEPTTGRLDRQQQPDRMQSSPVKTSPNIPVQARYDLLPSSPEIMEQHDQLQLHESPEEYIQPKAFSVLLWSLKKVIPQDIAATVVLNLIAEVVALPTWAEEAIRSRVEEHQQEITPEVRKRCADVFVEHLCHGRK